jgi:hypothetical protein
MQNQRIEIQELLNSILLFTNNKPKLKNNKTSKDKTIIFSPPTKALYFIFKKI